MAGTVPKGSVMRVASVPNWIADAIIVMVSLAFGVNFFGQFVIEAWKPDPLVYGAFMAIIPAALGLKSKGDSRSKGDSSEQ